MVIGMVRQDALRAIDLLDEHDAGQHVRPGERAEPEHEARLLDQGRIEPVGPADDESEMSAALFHPAGDALGEGGAVEWLAAAVERALARSNGESPGWNVTPIRPPKTT